MHFLESFCFSFFLALFILAMSAFTLPERQPFDHAGAGGRQRFDNLKPQMPSPNGAFCSDPSSYTIARESELESQEARAQGLSRKGPVERTWRGMREWLKSEGTTESGNGDAADEQNSLYVNEEFQLTLWTNTDRMYRGALEL